LRLTQYHIQNRASEFAVVAATFDPSQYTPTTQSYTYSGDFTVTYEYTDWKSTFVPNDFVLPVQFGGGGIYGGTGPNNMFAYDNPNHTGFHLSNVHWDFTSDSVGSVNFGSLTISTKDSVYTIAENAFNALGFSGLANAVKNVAVVKNALENVVTNGMNLIDYGVKHLGNPHFSHYQFDKLVDAYLKGSADTFSQALIDQNLFGNATAEQYGDAILGGVRLVGIGARDGSIPLEQAVSFTLDVNVADVLHLSNTWTGTVNADVVISPVASGTFDGGAGNDWIVGGIAADRAIGGSGNDYLSGGRGDDVLIPGTSDFAFLPGAFVVGGDYLDGGPGIDTAIWSQALSSYGLDRGLGAAKTTTLWNNDSATEFTSIEVLQFQDGVVKLQTSNPLIDNLFYDWRNSDVFHAGVDPVLHYDSSGWREGWDPNSYFSTNGLSSNELSRHRRVRFRGSSLRADWVSQTRQGCGISD
jgi:Ca2+-binding RTX toxin-like protein